MTIKTFEQFKNTDTLEEGLLDSFKIRNQILKVQGLVSDKYEELIEKNPKAFHDGNSVLKAVKKFAEETYKEIVTIKNAMSFNTWWEDFEKAHSYMLDKTIFKK
jgi:hypothetical protein